MTRFLPTRQRLAQLLFFLGVIEFVLVTWLTLWAAPDPKSAVLFGYSLPRLALAGTALVLAGGSLWLALAAGPRLRLLGHLERLVQPAPLFWALAVLWLMGLALLVWLTPAAVLGRFGSYFERARFLLFALCVFPGQFSLLYWLAAPRAEGFPWRPALVAGTALLALTGLMLVSGWGLTPEAEHWNVAGVPLTSLQLVCLLLIGGLFFGLAGLVRPRLPFRPGRWADWLVALVLFALALWFWTQAPVPHNEFSLRPQAPYFQSFPASDAQVHDLGALATLKGLGILFRRYTDKPLYIVFLALLHVLAGYDYNLLTFLHLAVMACMVPVLYWLGKAFHSRFFGVLLAGMLLVRQSNALALSQTLQFNAYPAQFLTEVPTLLALILVTLAVFIWFKAENNRSWWAFLAGSALGAASLVRLNPFLLIPALPVFLYFALRRKRDWFRQTLAFLLGCGLLIAPWMLTGTSPTGQTFFILKFQDIIQVRYGLSTAVPSPAVPETPVAPQPVDLPPVASPSASGWIWPALDLQTFPGFVLNHTLHNFVGSFLTLPDSLQPADQNLQVLMERPYWQLGIETLAPVQIPFVFLNLGLLALGLGWSWRRWRWAGLVPLFVFVLYALSLGFGRTSGSRYLVPLDWLAGFYFGLGLLSLASVLPVGLRRVLQLEPSVSAPEAHFTLRQVFLPLIALCLLAALIPGAQTLIPPEKTLCAPVSASEAQALAPQAASRLIYGEILYPELDADRLSFVLFTCQGEFSFTLADFEGQPAVGERVIAVLTGPENQPSLILLALPAQADQPPQLLWQGLSE